MEKVESEHPCFFFVPKNLVEDDFKKSSNLLCQELLQHLESLRNKIGAFCLRDADVPHPQLRLQLSGTVPMNECREISLSLSLSQST